MSYALGIDLGTTFTAAAVWRDGRVEMASLGTRSAAVPSVVFLREDETILTGETANRRALSEPHRVAREFKRRLGDTTPLLLGGSPYSAEALMARLLRSVVEEVAAREGGLPAHITVTHPANWGPYKTELLAQAVRIAGLDANVSYVTEPEAAAVFYAHQQRVEPGALVAVYDLGGGTFDAAVLRKTDDGFEILGAPEGIERLGGIDVDAAVFAHVARALGGRLEELDPEDPAAIAAVSRLREECVEAKEALSSDTDASIPVLLPNVSTEVRLTRAELEAMVRPWLHDSVEALRRALRSAGVTPEQLQAVLLVGGSSRMPIVSQLVGAELGRPVAVDAHPKHAIALGAAWLAGSALSPAAATVAAPVVPPPPPTAVAPVVPPPPTSPPPPLPPGGATPVPMPPAGPTKGSRVPLVIGGLVLAAAVVAGGVLLFNRDDEGGAGADPSDTEAAETTAATSIGEVTVATTAAPEVTTVPATDAPATTAAPTTTTLPLDEQCTDEIQANPRWVCLTAARVESGALVIEYVAEFGGDTPDVDGGFHLHVYPSDGTVDAATMGTQFQPASGRGLWLVEDRSSAIVLPLDEVPARDVFFQPLEPKVCARIANAAHELVPDLQGGFDTGNCVTIQGI